MSLVQEIKIPHEKLFKRNGELRSQILTFEWIQDYAKMLGGPTPTVTDIAVGRCLSRTTIRQHLDCLVDLGLISFDNNKICICGSIWIPPKTNIPLKPPNR